MSSDIEIIRYNPGLKSLWDKFVESSKNGTFLFKRDYMDYHSDRFIDDSRLIYRKGVLYSLLPANRVDTTLYSHQGLTYGGLIMDEKSTAEGILEVFRELTRLLRNEGVGKFIYKPVPHIYHAVPSEEDLYALFRLDARISVRNVSSVIRLDERVGFSKLRKRMIKKASQLGVTVKETRDYERFWDILEANLREKYSAAPVHSLDEMKKLSSVFSEIRLFGAYRDEVMLGGILLYFTKKVAKVQYISANPSGKAQGAVDAIVDYLLRSPLEVDYFDFGTSNEDGGRYLNESLIHQKEGFGGRAVCYDSYEITL